MPSLAQYLFHLADNPDAVKNHNSSQTAAVKQMTDFDLTSDQQKILLTGDEKLIQNEANKELRDRPEGGKVMSLSVSPNFIGVPPPR